MKIRSESLAHGKAIRHCLPHVVADTTREVKEESSRALFSELEQLGIRREKGDLQPWLL